MNQKQESNKVITFSDKKINSIAIKASNGDQYFYASDAAIESFEFDRVDFHTGTADSKILSQVFYNGRDVVARRIFISPIMYEVRYA